MKRGVVFVALLALLTAPGVALALSRESWAKAGAVLTLKLTATEPLAALPPPQEPGTIK
jgi:hypothetical protein